LSWAREEGEKEGSEKASAGKQAGIRGSRDPGLLVFFFVFLLQAMLYTIPLFSALRVVKAVDGSYKIPCNPANTLKGDVGSYHSVFITANCFLAHFVFPPSDFLFSRIRF
jgi:hypothetical protein